VGYMSATSTRILEGFEAQRAHHTPVSLGYDRIRLLAPVHIGDTIEIVYTIVSVDPERLRTIGDIVVTNQHGKTVAVAQHILKFVPNVVQSESGGSV
jgi:3-hydroxybutyryl-CoA dehydratase